jgi:integrase/recombinase XerD
MPTDFSKFLSDFISKYLIAERGLSRNTIAAYRDTFLLLLKFLRDAKKERIERITLAKITRETISDFLNWLQLKRKSSVSTRNMRLAAIHSFFRYLQLVSLEHMHESQRILSIKFKKCQAERFQYLTIEGIKLLLKQPDLTTKKGRRDLSLLSLMYSLGARVQEMIDLTPAMLQLGKPPIAIISGKGRKKRTVPLQNDQVDLLKKYLKENCFDQPHVDDQPLFQNYRKEKFTRAGINFILQKYSDTARKENPALIPEKISCHCLRHSRAMHLLQAGMQLVYIRDILGHVSVKTTEIYARVDTKQKREALEKAYIKVNPNELPAWESDKGLITWLKTF